MKKSILLYGLGIVAYMYISKKLKDKDSDLSKCLKKCVEKMSCMLEKFSEGVDMAKKSSETEEKKDGVNV